ncbi:MAG: Crp/Fnr family transcriptional regulator [Finegoldia magna]|uniref:Crp/Fnr family transcriptional regulator n=1 Tax=Finegoldia magna TaxID=1260 RepID=UPI0039A038A1
MEILESELFKNFSQQEIEQLLNSNFIYQKSYKKQQYIYKSGNTTDTFGLILKGKVRLEITNYWGSRMILSNKNKFQIIAESYAISGEKLIIDIIASEDSEILFINTKEIFANHNNYNDKLIKNLLLILSNDNYSLSQKLCQSPFKKIRQKLSVYLSSVALKKETNEFDIPFNRQELADYLNVDRSALSKELMEMKKEGLLDYNKNHFSLHKNFKEEYFYVI